MRSNMSDGWMMIIPNTWDILRLPQLEESLSPSLSFPLRIWLHRQQDEYADSTFPSWVPAKIISKITSSFIIPNYLLPSIEVHGCYICECWLGNVHVERLRLVDKSTSGIQRIFIHIFPNQWINGKKDNVLFVFFHNVLFFILSYVQHPHLSAAISTRSFCDSSHTVLYNSFMSAGIPCRLIPFL